MPDMSYLKVADTSYKVKDITARNEIGDINQAIRDLPQIRDAVTTNTTNISQLQTATQDLPQIRDKITTLQENTEDLPEIRQDIEQNANDISELNNTIAKNQIYDTASGAMAIITDGADDLPIKQLIVDINPVQDLHGYSSPWPAGGGKNLFPTTAASETVNGTTFTVHEDGSISVSGTPNAAISAYLFGTVILPAGTYIANGFADGSDSTIRMAVFNRTASALIGNIYNGVERTFTLETESEIRVYPIVLTAFDGTEVTFYPMIRKSTEADSTFVPYENICPITGWTQAKVTWTGKNLFDETNAVIYKRFFRVESGKNFWGYLANASSFVLQCKPNKTYTVSTDSTEVTFLRVGYISANPDTLSNADSPEIYGSIKISESGSITITTGDNAEYLVIQINTSAASTRNNKMQIELSSTKTNYEQYAGNTYDFILPSEAGTVYGGTLTVNADGTGTLSVNKSIVDLGTLYWVYNSTSQIFRCTSCPAKTPNIICSAYKTINPYVSWAELPNSSIQAGPSDTIVKDNAYTDAATFTAAVSGVKLVYELATPVSYTLTAQQVFNMLYGQNYIWADTGNVAVTYPADLKLYIDKVVAG